MLLAIDIGNSSIKFAIFEGRELFHRFSIQTKRDYTAEELMFDRLRLHEQKFIQVDIGMCIAASVVPTLNPVIAQVCREMFRITPQFVDDAWPLGLEIRHKPPSDIGADRLVNAFAAAKKYGKPVIVCSFGTATTIDAVSQDGVLLGGLIAPGVVVSAKALHEATALLPDVEISAPRRVLATTTETAIQSGIVFGHAAMVGGLIEMISTEAGLGKGTSVVATGGLASVIAPEISQVTKIDELLTLDGLRMLAELEV